MTVLSEIRADALSSKALFALLGGGIIGLLLLVFEISMAAFIFSGPLAPFLSQGIGMLVFGAFAVCLVSALASDYRGGVANHSVPPPMILGAIAAAMTLEGDALFMTMAAVVIVSALATTACCLLIGHLRIANLLRFVPYPVICGVIAGAGGGCVRAALSMMGLTADWRAAASLLEPALLWNWGPGVAYGLGLFLVAKRWNHLLALVTPVSFVLAAALFHAVLLLLDISGEEATAAGLLFTGMAAGGNFWPPFQPGDLAHVDWVVLVTRIPDMLALILITLLNAAIQLSSIELILATNQKLEWDREFKAMGRASVLAGLGGGLAGHPVFSFSALARRLGADTRLAGIVAALVVGSTLMMGDGILKLFPVPLLGGMLLYFGVSLLDEQLVQNCKRLPWTDFAVVVVIFAIISIIGFPAGVGIGIAITTASFAFRLSRVDLIEAEFTARERQSNRSRSIADRAILLAEGDRVSAYRLRGYIFFGSAWSLSDQLMQALGDDSPKTCILLDFSAVSGMDFSAVNSLCGFVRTAHEAGTRVVLSAAPAHCRDGMERNLPPDVHAGLSFEPDADRALERCEDIVIAARRAELSEEGSAGDTVLDSFAEDMESRLDRRITFEDMAHELRDRLEVREYAVGEALVTMGAPSGGLQLLLMGRASVYDAAGVRLHQCGPGDAIDLRGAFSARAAAVTALADEHCRTLTMTPSVRRWLEENRGELMLELYGYLLTAEADVDHPPGTPGAADH